MTINRNHLFLESFTVILILSIFGDVEEFVATLISNYPNSYFGYLIAYVVVFGIIIFAFYKITYKPPKYEKIVNKAQQRHDTIIGDLKTKMEKIDDKKRKTEEKKQAKIQKSLQQEEKKTQQQSQKKEKSLPTKTSRPQTIKSSKQNINYKSSPKQKSTRRRR